jgi:hypothetical protein
LRFYGCGIGWRSSRIRQPILTLSQAIVAEDNLYSLGVGGSDALIDRECVPKIYGTFIGFTLPKDASPDAFQSPCLFEWRTNIAGNNKGGFVMGASIGKA